MVVKLVGGIGLFLMGMVLLTDGLKAYAGEALRRALVRFTGTPLKAFGSGVVATLLVQSSSATTVAVIGFVSAGLLRFPQAVGVVFGASLGTTGTGWIVSILGLKVSLGYYALPLVGAGALLRLLGRGRSKALGLAVAGFGLIFIGIQTLQEGMAGLAGVFDLAALPAGGLPGHLLAMVIGTVLTVILQSSSAAVATTLTALHAGAVNFEQAASVVIGAAVGTTVTGVLAAIGGSVPAKRTAMAHVLFNLATALVAVVLLPVLLWGIGWAQAHLGLTAGTNSLAAFHTTFIALGVVLFLPWVERFCGFIERLLPEKGSALTRHLDGSLLNVPAVALEASRRAFAEIACAVFRLIRTALASGTGAPAPGGETEIRQAFRDARDFFARIPAMSEDEPFSRLRVAQMHAVDHLSRLLASLEPEGTAREILAHPRLQAALACTRDILDVGEAGLSDRAGPDWLERVRELSLRLADLRRKERPAILAQAASGGWRPEQTLELLDAMRWLDGVGYHAWRSCNYLGQPNPGGANPADAHPHPDA